MFRKLALTAAAVSLTAATPALAFPFGKKSAPKPEAAAAPAKPAVQPGLKPLAGKPAQPPAPPRKATAAERAAGDRLDPLARAAFWAREYQIDRTDTDAGLGLARALRALGQRDEAAQTAEMVLTLQPENVDAMLELAKAHLAAGKGFYAIAPLKKAQAARPRDWQALSLLGVAYDQVSRGAEAEVAWTQALALSPNNPAVLANQAMHFAAGGDVARAEQLLRTAVLQPGAGIAERQNLALVLGLQGKLAEAEQLTREDLPPEQAEVNIAWLRAAAGGAARSWQQVGKAN